MVLQNSTLWLCGPDRLEALNLLDNSVQSFDPHDFACDHLMVAKNGWVWAYSDTVRAYNGTKWLNPLSDADLYPVRGVSETSDGLIWIASAQLKSYNPKNGQVETIIPKGTNLPYIGPVFEASDKTLWLNEPLQGIVRWDRGSDSKQIWRSDNGFGGAEPFPEKYIEAHDGSIWLGARTGVYRIKSDLWQSWQFPNEGSKSRAMDDYSVLDLMEDFDGKIWGVFLRAGVMFWDGVKWNIVGPFEYPSGSRPQTVFQSSSGAIWIGFTDRDVYKYAEGKLQRYPTNIGTFLETSDHRLFGGGDGLFLYNPRMDQWEPYPLSQ
jgi:ligand-binding sensor domain-containing protein